jgi:threonine-phosphate decarboxylase
MLGRSHSLARDFCADIDSRLIETQIDREHGGNVYAWAATLGIAPEEIIDFSASINPLGPPIAARRAYRKSYEEILRYPDPHGTDLGQALAQWHGLEPDEVLPGNGSTQLIYLACATRRPGKALIVGPAFSEYANALKLGGATISFFPLAAQNHFELDTERFLAEWTRGYDIAVLTNPNSATGTLIPREAMEKIVRAAHGNKTFLVIDEAFIDFVEQESVKLLVRENPYVVVLRSLTKYFALPGLRLGYLLAHARTAKQLAVHQEPWSVNGPAQKVALACVADKRFSMRTDRWLRREKSFLSDALNGLKAFRAYASAANFLLVKIESDNAHASQLRSFLLRKKMLIRPCDSFLGLGPDYFRVSVRRRADNRRLVDALKEWTVQPISWPSRSF